MLSKLYWTDIKDTDVSSRYCFGHDKNSCLGIIFTIKMARTLSKSGCLGSVCVKDSLFHPWSIFLKDILCTKFKVDNLIFSFIWFVWFRFCKRFIFSPLIYFVKNILCSKLKLIFILFYLTIHSKHSKIIKIFLCSF
jgi:hypothetical protein